MRGPPVFHPTIHIWNRFSAYPSFQRVRSLAIYTLPTRRRIQRGAGRDTTLSVRVYRGRPGNSGNVCRAGSNRRRKRQALPPESADRHDAENRERIGMDLHDGVIQSIYAIGLMLDDTKHRLTDDAETWRAGESVTLFLA